MQPGTMNASTDAHMLPGCVVGGGGGEGVEGDGGG